MIVETGVGQARVHRALDWMLSRPLVRGIPYEPTLVISAGFSGALRQGLHVGDIVVATEVVGPEGECHQVSWPKDDVDRAERSALSAPRSAQPPLTGPVNLHRGRLLTVDKFVPDPEAKRALGVRHDALAVDMETATVAGRCNRAGIPFACIRAISDDSHTPLPPDLDYIIDNGRISLPRLALSLLRRPPLACELWRLARDTRIAAERLANYLTNLLVC